MPRSLTENEKELQRQNFLNHGKNLIFRYGLSRVSVDDIVKEAGMAKGSFYNYFSSKDDFFYQLIFQVHEEGFIQIKDLLQAVSKLPSKEKRIQIKKFFWGLMNSPIQQFMLNEHDEIEKYLARYSKETLAELKEMELQNYQDIISKLDLTEKNPMIIHNYIHIIFFGVGHKEMLNLEYVEATVEIMIEGLLNYLDL